MIIWYAVKFENGRRNCVRTGAKPVDFSVIHHLSRHPIFSPIWWSTLRERLLSLYPFLWGQGDEQIISLQALPSRLRCISHFLASCHKGGLKVTGLAATWRCVLFVRIHTKRPTISDALQGRTSQGWVLKKLLPFILTFFKLTRAGKFLRLVRQTPFILSFSNLMKSDVRPSMVPPLLQLSRIKSLI